MPEVTIKIGQRPFTVNCPEGEEPQLQKARDALDAEASTLLAQAGACARGSDVADVGSDACRSYLGFAGTAQGHGSSS